MLQRFIQRMNKLAQKNDKGGQWQVFAVGTHGEYVADSWEELEDAIAQEDTGQTVFDCLKLDEVKLTSQY